MAKILQYINDNRYVSIIIPLKIHSLSHQGDSIAIRVQEAFFTLPCQGTETVLETVDPTLVGRLKEKYEAWNADKKVGSSISFWEDQLLLDLYLEHDFNKDFISGSYDFLLSQVKFRYEPNPDAVLRVTGKKPIKNIFCNSGRVLSLEGISFDEVIELVEIVQDYKRKTGNNVSFKPELRVHED